MVYDSLGRLIYNFEPNTWVQSRLLSVHPPPPAAWIYAYDDLGEVVGSSDARGCGKNVAYDGVGRMVSEDYSPCDASQPAYTSPQPNGDGTEVLNVYEPAGVNTAGMAPGVVLETNRLEDRYSRGAHDHYGYDGRGRLTSVTRQVAAGGATAPALWRNVPSSVAERYAPQTFTATYAYDDLDRVVRQTTGARAAEMRATDPSLTATYGPSAVAATYNLRDALASVQGSYGTLVASTGYTPDGRITSIQLGDYAKTVATYSYKDKWLRLSEISVARASGWAASNIAGYSVPASTPPSTFQNVLQDDQFTYDDVGNPQVIVDNRVATEWLPGSLPVSRSFGYDDNYRVTTANYSYGPQNVPDRFYPTSPAATPATSPLPAAPLGERVMWQQYAYDGLGNLISSTDDLYATFDRSLGGMVYGGGVLGGPNQLRSAAQSPPMMPVAGSRVVTTQTQYDAAGNLTALRTSQMPYCPSGSTCLEDFLYTWDEVGQLAEARRWDSQPTLTCSPTNNVCQAVTTYPLGTANPAIPNADVSYLYDGGGLRVLRASTQDTGTTTYSLEVFDSLRLNHATWSSSGYEDDATTEGVYLAIGGQSFGRVVYAELSPTLTGGKQHVFLELGDHLGSTSIVLDKETGELVERTTFLAYGGIESDYRPARWQNFREDYKFTGKEDDVEIGLQYFGARYYSPQLGLWISPDPLTIHGVGGDLNPYAYVSGRVASAIDPSGLTTEPSEDSDEGGELNDGSMQVAAPPPPPPPDATPPDSTGLVPASPAASPQTVVFSGQTYPHENADGSEDVLARAPPRQQQLVLPSEAAPTPGNPNDPHPFEPLKPDSSLSPPEPRVLEIVGNTHIVLSQDVPKDRAPLIIPRDHTDKLLSMGWVLINLLPDTKPATVAVEGAETAFHHLLPQQFESEFAERGLDVHDYTVELPTDLHRKIHADGWNTVWEDFLYEKDSLPTARAIMRQLKEMANDFNISPFGPIVRYSGSYAMSVYVLTAPVGPWGDYGRLLMHGMSRHLPRQDDCIQLERTAPFVPPITFPGGDIVVDEATKQALATLPGLEFASVIKSRIVRYDWRHWDLASEKPTEYPRGNEPENYILDRPHDAQLAESLPAMWELRPMLRWGTCSREVVGRGPLAYKIHLTHGAGRVPEVFRAADFRYVFVSPEGRRHFEGRLRDWVRFEEVFSTN